MARNLVSIVTIAYNDREGLERTIRSVRKQDYENLEYIVIDGGSGDGSKELIEQNQDFISIWCSEPDKGIYNAMNKGVDRITGEWVLFMNSGDEFYSDEAISKAMSKNVDENVGIVYGDVCLNYSPYGSVIKHYAGLSGGRLLGICHQSTFIRASLMKKYRYDESFKIVADVNFFNTLLRDGYEFVHVPVVISTFLAFEGISAKPSMQIMKEYQRVYGNDEDDDDYKKAKRKWRVKIIICHLLPHKLYKYLQYRKDLLFYNTAN